MTLVDEFDKEYSAKVDHIWTVFAGLRFNFTPNIAAKGLYYHQGNSVEEDSTGVWSDVDLDNASAWKAIIDVKQEALGFTSLWLEYDHLDRDFYMPYGNVALTLMDEGAWNSRDGGAGFLGSDADVWRVGATQQWNDKWSTWAYVAGITQKNGADNGADAKMTQWGLGVEYQYSESVAFALGYLNVDWNDDAELSGYNDDHIVRFRTGVVF
jgi:hypothetical protein